MRHRKITRNLSRDTSHRKAMLRNMVASLFRFGQLETTDAKAKELRRVAEKMITLSKRGDLHARRQALAFIKDKAVTRKLFDELKERFLSRQGGYVRIVKKGTRKGDGAPLSIIQILPEEGKKTDKKRAKAATSGVAKDTKDKKETPPKEKKTEVEKKSEKSKGGEQTASTQPREGGATEEK